MEKTKVQARDGAAEGRIPREVAGLLGRRYLGGGVATAKTPETPAGREWTRLRVFRAGAPPKQDSGRGWSCVKTLY